MLPALHWRAVLVLVDALKNDFEWALTGSAGFALQGVSVVPRDVDVQTSRDGAHEIERRLAAYVIAPVVHSATDRVRSYFGRLNIAGIDVEVMGDVQKRLPDGAWEPPVDVARHKLVRVIGGVAIPVLDLAYEEQAYRRLGRTDRADELRRFLARRRGETTKPGHPTV